MKKTIKKLQRLREELKSNITNGDYDKNQLEA